MADGDLLEKKRLPVEKLRNRIDLSALDFETTADVEPLRGTIGQERALDALGLGLDMKMSGFNIYAAGPVGTGRNTTVRTMAERIAEEEPVPSDWCYVHNFEDSEDPKAIKLPPGKGREFRDDMDDFARDCHNAIQEAFEGEKFEQQRQSIRQELQQQRNELINELREKARELDHAIEVTPAGIAAVPLVDGEPVSQDEFEQLDEEKQEELQEKGQKVQELATETISEVRQLEQEGKEKVEELDQEVGLFAVGHLIQKLVEKYSDLPPVVEHLKAVKEDIIENIEVFKQSQQAEGPLAGLQARMQQQVFNKYRVNVIIDNACSEGAPVVDERNPTFYNLFGQIEYRAQMGGMTTDFTMIRGGAVHKANGGYLVLQALDVLRNPFSWDGLKRVIRTGEIKIENAWERYHPTPAATLEPEPIPVDITVVLVGSPLLYHLLYMLDEDFRRLFKVKADFDVEMDLTDEHLEQYAAFISARCEEGELPPFDREAAARLIEHGVRLAEHQGRLSTQFLYVADVIAEAGHRAQVDGAERVAVEHVRGAIEGRRYRSRMLQDKVQRLIEEGQLIIDTDGAEPGQVNGLSVADLGDYRFGKPTRITSVTSVGRSGVVNIERESKLSGSIHDKGVLILTGYLARLFGQDKPLSLTARLCFEQSYAGVEGDSASCAELYALLSTLADLPLRQDIAVTGSVNQRGQVQPIGGVNEKIEGFFEVCRDAGLTGQQGVLIPARNLQNLMLNDEVMEAVEDGKFNVWAVDTVEEGIEILTGTPAGERQEGGTFPEDTVYGRADRRLREMAEVLKEYGPAPEEGPGKEGDED
ncbi:MAG: ATP-binding protein [Candidatus Brocadiia bacterium]